MKTYEFDKVINPDRFGWQVQSSSITICIHSMNVASGSSYITFKKELSVDEYSVLELLIEEHANIPMVHEEIMDVSVMEVPKYAIHEIDRTYIERMIDVTTEENNVGPYIFSHTSPYTTVLLGGEIYINQNMVGDTLKIVVHFAPNDIVGAIIAPTVIGDKKIIVDPGIVQNKYIWKSYEVALIRPDGTKYELGECIKIEGNEIHFANDITEAIVAGSYVTSIAVPLPYCKITHYPGSIRIGDGTWRGAYVPAGARYECIYNNNNGTIKDVGIIIEYYV